MKQEQTMTEKPVVSFSEQGDVPPPAEGGAPISVAAPTSPQVRILAVSGPEEEDRYTRIRQLGWDLERLQNAYALVVGAGALGNEVLKNLALLGWGHIVVVDMDAIEASNLARSVLFRQSDVGPDSFKVVAAARRVRELNPDVHILPVVGTVQDCLGLGVYRRMDVVFGCLDNRQARLDVSRACWSTLTPYIDTGLDSINGDVRTYVPPYTACYGCNMTAEERRLAKEQNPCLKVKQSGPKPVMPTAPTISAMMAGWQTQIAVKHLHGKPIPAGERIAIYGATDGYDRYRLPFNPDCLDHNRVEIIGKDSIVEMLCGSADLTLRELLSVLQDELGMGPETVVKFDFDLLLEGVCRQCGLRKEFFRRLTSVYDKEILCPACGEQLSLVKQHLFDGTEPYADRLLSDLAVPHLHILLAMNPVRNLYQFVELSADFGDFFNDVPNHNPKVMPVELALPNGEQRIELLPMRLPIHALVAWRADEWGLSQPANPEGWILANLTQDFTYRPDDCLVGRDTRPNDLLCLAAGTYTPPQAALGSIRITLPRHPEGGEHHV